MLEKDLEFSRKGICRHCEGHTEDGCHESRYIYAAHVAVLNQAKSQLTSETVSGIRSVQMKGRKSEFYIVAKWT